MKTERNNGLIVNLQIFLAKVLHFTYVTLFKPPLLKKLINGILLAFIPKKLRVGSGVIYLNPKDPVVSGALTLRVYEREEQAFFLRSCRQGMTVVDVGANVGLYTSLAMHQIGKTGRLISIEPFQDSLRYLKQTIDENKKILSPSSYPEVHLIEAAASDKAGTAHLFINPINGGDNRLYADKSLVDTAVIQTERIDQMLKSLGVEEINYLKIDVQGYEFHALRGAQEILKRSQRTIILSEFWPEGLQQAGDQPIDYLFFLESLDFTLYQLDQDKLRRLNNRADCDHLISAHPGVAYCNIVALKGFSPEEFI